MTRIKIKIRILKDILTLIVYMWRVVTSIFSDVKNGRAVMRKWHLHAPVGLLLGMLVQFILGFTYAGISNPIQYFISGGVVIFICLAWEIRQGFAGANRNENEWFEAVKDIVVGSVAGILGIALLIHF